MANNFAKLIQDLTSGIGNNTNTMMIGEIKFYNSSNNTAEIIPLHSVPGQNAEYQPIPNIPIGFYSLGGFSIKVSPKIGDKILLIFCDYDIENLKIDGVTKTSRSNRTHSLEDAIAIPLSINFLNNSFSSTEDLVIKKEGTNSYIKIKQDGTIVINSDRVEIGEGASNAVALAGGGSSSILYAK